MGRLAGITLAVSLVAAPSLSQGLAVHDTVLTLRNILENSNLEADLAVQRDKVAVSAAIASVEREQLAVLRKILEAQTRLGAGTQSDTVAALESGGAQPDRSAAAVYGTGDIDPNPHGAGLFGDAAETVEELIIRVAQETHRRPGVRRAGLSEVQWRALLQALIWQESRFSIGLYSPAGAYGLTQIMPDTASDLGINPAYYDSPYLQVEGGARYLDAQLLTFDGNIINALAAYNAGPGRVFEYGGVPPFAETQHYVQVIPDRYNHYLSRIGGIEALGTIDPKLFANAQLSLVGHGSSLYGSQAPAQIEQAVLRIQDIVTRIGSTDSVQDSVALNTYARAELVRLVAARVRLKAVRGQTATAAQLAQATARMAEGDFMDFSMEDLQ
ncbi:MAG: lytic transglycosylase domain-containing protein [Pseudomonadota bacterium]|nr:lytic transglycosylase domain-containing protein [Pseudomonadota bacterium]